jgi:uncharacterized protein
MNIKTDRGSYTLISRLGILINSEIANELQSLYPEEFNEEELIEKLGTKITDEEIEEHICSTRNLTLNITEECNFRCKYCAFSGNYELARTHSSEKMTYQTATKAVNCFLNLINNNKGQTKNNSISIGFYGGEALLEFELIKKIVKYVREKTLELGMNDIYNIKFRISTNGYLLIRQDVLDFLIKNNFKVDISLDGPKKEHNKFRVTKDLGETWDTIWKNINNIKTNYPKFYSDNVNYLVTLHPWHDTSQIDQFFLENPEYFKDNNIRANLVNDQFLSENIKKKWFGRNTFKSSELIISRRNERIALKVSMKKISSASKFTGMCFPGQMKLFVSSDGKISVCERIKQNMPI